MTQSSRTRRIWLPIITVLVVVGTAAIIVLRHKFPKAITTEDTAIVAASLTLLATIVAYWSAKESRDAATDSRRALRLHFRPGDVRIGFSVRDPNDMNAQMAYTSVPSPARLWVSLTFWPPTQSTYQVVWVGDDGQARSPRWINPPPGGDYGWLLLEGISAEETKSADGPPQIRAEVRQLKILCTDDQSGARWEASRSWPAGSFLGSYALPFELIDG